MKPSERIIGIDIGGANIKVAMWSSDDSVQCASMSFPLWKQPNELGAAVKTLIDQLGTPDRLAVTMTGELADCFATRRSGVEQILQQLTRVVSAEQMQIYAVGGAWLSAGNAIANPWAVAASNWYALSSWLGRWPATASYCRSAVLIDVGSTTVDIVPLKNNQPCTQARTDRERLEKSQLVYTGISRTPVCAILQHMRLGDSDIPLMAELFATADDAYLALGLVEEQAHDHGTADGRPRTKTCAMARIARMLGEDSETLNESQTLSLAEQIIDAQAQQVARAIERNLASLIEGMASDSPHSAPNPYLVLTGHGWPLHQRALAKLHNDYATWRLSASLSADASRCAPAVAVAWLAHSDA